MATADDGKSYMYGPDEEGNNVWTRSLGEVGTETERPSLLDRALYKAGRAIGIGYTTEGQPKTGGKGSEWLGAMNMENHFGGGSNLRPFHDPLKTNPNHSMRESWEYRRAQTSATDNIIGGTLVGGLATPIAIAGAVQTAPIWLSYLTAGANYTWQGAQVVGQYSWQALRTYHNIFGKNGGYGSIGANYFIQSGQTGSMNPMNHNTFGYIGSAFTPSSISGQMVVGAAGGLINYTPNNEIPLRGFWNRHIGITTVEMINGGLSPLYMLGGARIGFIFGATQQIVGGRAIDYLEKTIPN